MNINKALISLLIIFFTSFTHQNKAIAQEHFIRNYKDHELKAYFDACKQNIKHRKVLLMADTLFHKASRKKDVKMQTMALTIKIDHFYFRKGTRDSLMIYANQLRETATNHNLKRIYYFIWTNRVILYQIKTGNINTALYETKQLLEEIQIDNDTMGLLYCYNVLSKIYYLKGLEKDGYLWLSKQLALLEKENILDYNVALLYLQVADYHIKTRNREKAMEAIKKARKRVHTNGQKFILKLKEIDYHTEFDENELAERKLKESIYEFNQKREFDPFRKNLFRTVTNFYVKNNYLNKALNAFKQLKIEENNLHELCLNNRQIKTLSSLYFKLGKKDLAFQLLENYLNKRDSINAIKEDFTTSEFASLLDLEKVKREKNRLILKAQEKELKQRRNLIIGLIIIMTVLFFFFNRENLLNKKLKASKEILKIRNSKLKESQNELKIAKEKAEAASMMKTKFINNMSHEIRTPLNSIVGFSQILSDCYSDQKLETYEFARIIKRNSNNLLKLINDVLIISDFDKDKPIDTTIDTNIKECCELALNKADNYKKENVKLIFQPDDKEYILKSNPKNINLILGNLMHNAAKFTSNGNITLKYKLNEREKKIYFSIIDTGIGIPKEKQSLVFERFYKSDNFTQGTGLGLPICRAACKQLKGTLYIDNTYREGTKFDFILPYQNIIML